MNFASDNWAGAHPAIAEALAVQSAGFATAYGQSELDRAVERHFCELFEREVAVFFVATGTAANALSMAFLNRPGGVAFGHTNAHMLEDEGGAPEHLTGGARMHPVPGALGRMDARALEAAIHLFPAAFVHAGQPMAVSLTQATEIGTVYSLDDIETIATVCRAHGLPLHMDGARFANALAALGTTPAEMTWKRGVEVLSFGATKNGCWCAEAVVIMDPARAGDMHFLRKRAAHLFSKSRFIAAQFDAYFRDELWLKNARHANEMAARLARTVRNAGGLRLAWEPQANEVFAIMKTETADALKRKEVFFHPWTMPDGSGTHLAPDERLYRFVTSFATTPEEIDRFGEMLG
ncbi:low specificity L-threonine aldolase [Chelativorans sp. M5D2P16]|uniref:threonine aldolase family protein n=1 Tax=Chelativorans sp. M5D2P16 TaxID=3095678 RepID=UPI002ACA6C89|nr:low specificity L-threonine aldolase [Chelativorans sp. M5D2P16]MDZ5697536.1 low specificity L-threonine aldolase [Chelativorans sp. M5D2P16]